MRQQRRQRQFGQPVEAGDHVAKALEKDANQSDLKMYVQGKLNLNDIGGKTKGSGNNAKVTVQNCARTAINHDQSTAA